MSRFIGKTPTEREGYYGIMSKLYGQRGKAAHASNIDKFDYRCLEWLVRQGIKRYMQLIKENPSTTHSDIVKFIEFD